MMTTTTMDTTSANPSNPAPPPAKQNKPLACTACRARKLGCNRVHPCHNCIRSGAECIFPARRRVQRPRKTKNTELLQRLSRLENIVGKAGIENLLAADRGKNADPTGPASGVGGIGAAREPPYGEDASSSAPIGRAGPAVGDKASTGVQAFIEEYRGSRSGGEVDEERNDVASDSVSLDPTSTKYLSAQFWSNLCGEVEGLRQILEHSTDSDPDSDENVSFEGATPESAIGISTTTNDNDHPGSASAPATSSGLLPGYLLTAATTAPRHPSPEQVRYLTATYFESFDVILKILHRPTTTTALLAFADAGCDRATLMSPAEEALFFAIYYAAITTLSDAACRAHLGAARDALARCLQAAVEHALARADYLNTDALEPLQALTIYVTCLRSHSRSRSSWALLSLPIRLARALELHREGGWSSSAAGRRSGRRGRSVYETELRRRLWWMLVVLDVRAVEDRGMEPAIPRGSYDTRLPLNVNDEDFGPDSDSGSGSGVEAALAEREGPTDMTFSLCTAQSSGIYLYLNYLSDGKGLRAPPTEEETVAHAQHLEALFVSGIDQAAVGRHIGAYIASFTVRLIILKLWLVTQYPVSRRREQRGAGGGGQRSSGAQPEKEKREAALPMRTARMTRHEIIVSTTTTADAACNTITATPTTGANEKNNGNSDRNRALFPAAVSREATLRTALSIMELSHQASTTGPFAARFGWWSATYVQWHPLAVALAELCHHYTHRTNAAPDQQQQPSSAAFDALADRAWALVETVFPLWADRIADSKRGTLWRPIRKLYRKAKAARATALGGGGGGGSTAAAAAAAVGPTSMSDPPSYRGGARSSVGQDAGRGEAPVFHGGTTMPGPSAAAPMQYHMTPTASLDVGGSVIPPLSSSAAALTTDSWIGAAAPQQQQQQQQPLEQLQQPPLPPPNSNASAGATANWFNDAGIPWPDISFDLPMDGGGGGGGWDAMDWSTWDEFVDDTYAEGPLTSSSDGS